MTTTDVPRWGRTALGESTFMSLPSAPVTLPASPGLLWSFPGDIC